MSLIYGYSNLYKLTFRNGKIVEYQNTNLSQSAISSYIQINIGHVQIYKLKEPLRIHFMRSPSKTDKKIEVHYYMRITQNCGKNSQLEDYGLLHLVHEHRILRDHHTHPAATVGDIRSFQLSPKAVALDIWWPQQMFLVIEQGSSLCAEQVHYRIVSVPISPALLFLSCSFKVVFGSQ